MKAKTRWIVTGFLALVVYVCLFLGVLIFPPAPNYTKQRVQDSTFVAEIKQCCAKGGWVWADSPEVRRVARQIYGDKP